MTIMVLYLTYTCPGPLAQKSDEYLQKALVSTPILRAYHGAENLTYYLQTSQIPEMFGFIFLSLIVLIYVFMNLLKQPQYMML